MNSDPRSHGLWEASAPPAPETRPLEGDITVDVAIIGGGYTGLSAALHLAEGGATVAVLEAEEIGFGGSGRNVGLVNAGLWVTPDTLPRLLGPVYGHRLLHLLGDGPSMVFELVKRHQIDCEAVHHGTLHCANDAAGLADLKHRWEQWKALGAPVELLDAEATRRAVGTEAYVGSLLDRRAGTIQPLAYARGLARAALQAGAQLYTRSRVTAAHDRQSHWELETEQGRVKATWMLVATNAYTGRVWPQLQQQLTRLPYFNLATRPLTPEQQARILPNREGVWDTRKILSSFRYDRAGRLVFGSVGAIRGLGAHVHADWGRRSLARLFPELGKVEFDYAWYGQIGTTPDALPRFHQLARNTFCITGYNGRGISPGTVFGHQLAQLVLGRQGIDEMPLPLSEPGEASHKQLRESCYEYGAIAAHAVDARF